MAQPKIAVDLILKKLAEDTGSVKDKVQKASKIMLGQLDTDISKTPYEIVYEEDRIKLKYYKPDKIKQNTPLLIIYALINRETMLDLQPGRSVIQTFLEYGIEVYMLDWGYPKRKDKYVTIDDHVNVYINNIIDFVRNKHNIDKINLMGICMGGVFSVIYSSLYPQKIKNLVTTVTPTNYDTDKGLLHIWMKNTSIVDMADTLGNMPGDLMNFGFLILNPARLMLDKYIGFIENIDNKSFVENFIRMEKWIFDSPDVPFATFKQFITDCYQQNLLIQNKLKVGNNIINLKNITMPILNIFGQYDHLVPPEAAQYLIDKVGSKDKENLCLATGHIGIYVSSKFQKLFAPKIAEWLEQRQ